MATIDSRIALGVQPTVQLESPANSLAKMLQLQGLQQQNEAARYDMDLKRQDAEQTNRLRTFLASGIDLDTQEGRNALYRAAPTKADAIIKSRVDTRKAITDAEKSAFEVSQSRYKAYKQTLGALYNAPNLSKDMVMSAGQEMVALGVITPELYQRAVAGLPDDVAALRQQLQQGLAAQLTPEQVFTVFSAKPTAVDDGQNISYRDLNPNSPTFGQNVGGPSVKKQQSPDSVASNETTRRGQNMVDARARETNEIMRDLNRHEKQLKIDELEAEKRKRNEASLAAKDAADVQITAIDRVINHPGLGTATGLSGAINPKNYIPGTDATNFRVALDQVKGTAFLQAFQALKGGGAITEMEGKKAEAAMARLDRAQSTQEFTSALKELREVMVKGRNRMSGNQGGANGSFDAPAKPSGAQVIDFGDLK